MERKTKTVTRYASDKLAIICSFIYSRNNSDTFRPISTKNGLTDLKNYLLFCQDILMLNKNEIIIITDIASVGELIPLDGILVIHCQGVNNFSSSLERYLCTRLPKRFFFFFSGHGTRNEREGNWLIIPSVNDVLKFHSYQLMMIFSRNLTHDCECLWFFDCCNSEGITKGFLPYRWSSKGVRKEAITTIEWGKRKIYSFHSSKLDELSGFLANNYHGSLFTFKCLSQLTRKIEKQEPILFPKFLKKLEERMFESIVDKKQPLHKPVYLTNQNLNLLPIDFFL